ncbi:MAG TPA: nucleotidyltransferase family protein [Armatimonadota bacterium]|nr:nucleotidyltransferase family protein [Armatimonadota bacterium]
MTRDELLSRLRSHRAEITALGTKSLALFGSAARGQAGPDSDVDLLVEFEGRATFDRYMALKEYLEELLGCQVDLVTRKALKPRLRPRVEEEAVHVA